MFVYSHFSNPSRLVQTLRQSGLRSICFIDDCGLTIPSLLEACYTYNISCCFGASFSAFIGSCSERKTGFLIATTPQGVKLMYQTLAELKSQCIPYISHDMLHHLEQENVYLFNELERHYFSNYFTNLEQIHIQPIAYLDEHQWSAHTLIGEAIADGLVLDEQMTTDPWIYHNAKPSHFWKELLLPASMELDLLQDITWDHFNETEQQQIRAEASFFCHEGVSICLKSLAEAKKQGIEFIPHGDLYTSLLAFALGIISEKPSLFHLHFNFNRPFQFSVVLEKKERSKLMFSLGDVSAAKLMINKPKMSIDDTMKKVAAVLQLSHQPLLHKLKSFSNIEDFKKVMRTRFLFHESEEKLFRLSTSLLDVRSKKLHVQSHRIVFVPKDCYVMQYEDTAFIDDVVVNMLSIASIQCLLPPNKDEQDRFDFLLSEGAKLDSSTLSFYYYKLRTVLENHLG